MFFYWFESGCLNNSYRVGEQSGLKPGIMENMRLKKLLKRVSFVILGFVIFCILITAIIMKFSLYGSSEHNITVNGVNRSYLLHLPKNYDPDKKYPLVLFFHGYGNSPKIAEWYSGMSRKGDREGFIVVYPKGTGYGPGFYLSWNAGFCCDLAAKNKVDDVGFTKVLVESLEKNYSIDPSRVYATGHSNGALFVHRLGLELSDMFAAVAPLSGSVGGITTPKNSAMNNGMKHPRLKFENKPTFKPVPILIAHGKLDTVVPYGGGKHQDTTFDSVDKTVSFWLKNNTCDLSSKEISKENGTITEKYVCQNSAVEFVTYPDGHHAWFGGNYDSLKYGGVKYEKATDLVWDFFKKYKK